MIARRRAESGHTRKEYPPYHHVRGGGIDRRMARWHRRKRKDAQLLEPLRAHVETMWAIASTLTGDDATAVADDDATAVEIVREVVPRTLPPLRRRRAPGLRLKIVIATTEAASTRVFSPHARRSSGAADAAPLNPRASALTRAFSRRLSWDVQALLWATEVEGIAELEVERRLGHIYPRSEAARVALRLAYLDLRGDLDQRCRATLGNVFGSSAGPEKLAEDIHLNSCAVCRVETRWLSDLRSALGILPSAMPATVWEEVRRFLLEDDGGRSCGSLGNEGDLRSDTVTSPEPSPSPEASPGKADVELPAADSANPTAGDTSPATDSREHTLVRRTVETQKAGNHVLRR